MYNIISSRNLQSHMNITNRTGNANILLLYIRTRVINVSTRHNMTFKFKFMCIALLYCIRACIIYYASLCDTIIILYRYPGYLNLSGVFLFLLILFFSSRYKPSFDRRYYNYYYYSDSNKN